jgi:hypothetical protein
VVVADNGRMNHDRRFGLAQIGQATSMSGPFIVLLLVLLAAGGAVAILMRGARERARTESRLESPHTATLDYAVPLGQDPAVVLAALNKHGVEAIVDPGHGHQIVRIESGDLSPKRRDEIRSIIATADATALDHGVPLAVSSVRFEDEDSRP